MTTTTYDRVQQAAAAVVRAIAPRVPKVGLVLGSGLGGFADGLEDPVAVPYDEIPGFAASRIPGHAGKLVAGLCGRQPIIVMQGRVHYYEGHRLDTLVLPVRTMVAAGCKVIVVTNAAGGIRDDLKPGDLVLISDHINLTGENPLMGDNDDRLGPRFPDMSTAYDPELRMLAHQQAQQEGIDVSQGVYCWMTGPSYETPAEIRMLRTIGGDLCGMSTVPEVIAAVHMGARVLGISCVTNKAAGLGGKLCHDEVKEVGAQVQPRFVALLSRICAALKKIS